MCIPSGEDIDTDDDSSLPRSSPRSAARNARHVDYAPDEAARTSRTNNRQFVKHAPQGKRTTKMKAMEPARSLALAGLVAGTLAACSGVGGDGDDDDDSDSVSYRLQDLGGGTDGGMDEGATAAEDTDDGMCDIQPETAPEYEMVWECTSHSGESGDHFGEGASQMGIIDDFSDACHWVQRQIKKQVVTGTQCLLDESACKGEAICNFVDLDIYMLETKRCCFDYVVCLGWAEPPLGQDVLDPWNFACTARAAGGGPPTFPVFPD